MSVDIFGRGTGELSLTVKRIRGPPGVGFKLTTEEQYDIEQKRLCNVAEPMNPGDAVNLLRLQRADDFLRTDLYKLESKIAILTERFNKYEALQILDTEQYKSLHEKHAELIDKLEQRVIALETKWMKHT